jgi:hypothetical protein
VCARLERLPHKNEAQEAASAFKPRTSMSVGITASTATSAAFCTIFLLTATGGVSTGTRPGWGRAVYSRMRAICFENSTPAAVI